MDLDRLQALSDIVDEFRKQPQSWTLLDVAQALRNRSLAGLTIDEVVEFPARFHHDHDYRELCVPSALASFVGKALSTRHIHSILDPWPGSAPYSSLPAIPSVLKSRPSRYTQQRMQS